MTAQIKLGGRLGIYPLSEFRLLKHFELIEAIAPADQLGGNPSIIHHLIECPPTATEPLGDFGGGEQSIVLRDFLAPPQTRQDRRPDKNP